MIDKKYPYIGDNGTGQVTVIYSKGKAFHLGGRFKGEYAENYLELEVKNITREYLANTYGKCESQEHADFICKMAENHGFVVESEYEKERAFFNFYEDTLDFWIDEGTAKTENEKLIHLPLPPKEKTMKEAKPTYTKEMHERGEYPPIGSKVKLRDGVGVVELGVDSNGFFPVLTNGKYRLLDIGCVKPIPTIEDELTDFFKEQSGMQPCDLAKYALTKYNITPKNS